MRYFTALTILCIGLVLSGFKAPDTLAGGSKTVAAKTSKSRNTTLSGKDAKKKDKKSKNDKNSGDDEHEDGDLTKRELRLINNDLNSGEYYGFLLSDYEDPKFIDWDMVFYGGAGLENVTVTKAIEKEYLKKTRSDDIYGDFTALSGDDIEDFVQRTTGMSYSKMRNPLDWVYLKKFDLYLFEHGDTNYVESDVISGYVYDGVYTVRYIHNNWWGEYADCEYEVCFTKNGDDYCFISNTPDISTGASSQYIIPDSDSRYLTEADIRGMDADTLRLARNEIYARHGRKFKDSKLQSYFDSKNWYYPSNDSDSKIENSLNKFEKKNIQFISKHEK